MTEHTPTPYSLQMAALYDKSILLADGTIFRLELVEGNAETIDIRNFIVTACNSHKALVEAMEGCLASLGTAVAECMEDSQSTIIKGQCLTHIAVARAALQAAKGGKR